MDAVLRGAAIYVFLLLIVRITGRRELGEMTAFDFVLLLIVGESTQQALLGDDYSVTNAMLVICTLVVIDLALSLVKGRLPRIEQLVDGLPLVVVENGRPLRERLRKARIDEQDVLSAARQTHGLERMEQIKYAVLECTGTISVIPAPQQHGS